MIELNEDRLVVSFPEVHEEAWLEIEFQRTLRIPDDNREYPLPPGLGRFPLVHTEDYADRVPERWVRHGGVILPMYQSEALWINFHCSYAEYPFAIKVAAGKIDAVTGNAWDDSLHRVPQDYLVVPRQPWLDGFNVAADRVRQFVAMPLGQGFSAEEQLTGEASVGGLQLIVYPMKAERYRQLQERESRLETIADMEVNFSLRKSEISLAPGGLMRQKIYRDRYGIRSWDKEHCSRCFIHLANSEEYVEITGKAPPHAPPTAKSYTEAGLPWFEYYAADAKALEGSGVLAGLDSVEAMRIKKGLEPCSDNESVQPSNVKSLGPGARRVTEGEF